MSSRIRMLEDDDAEESEQQDNTNPLTNSQHQQQQHGIVSMTREELQVLLTRTIDRRVLELFKQSVVPMVSMIVKEQIELAQEKFFASLRQNSASGSSSTEPRSLQLQFRNNPSLPIFSGFLIKAEGESPIEVAIVDYSTQEVVKSGPEASVKVMIIAVEGHFDGNGSCSWSVEGLRSYIVKQKDGINSLLQGKVHLTLKEGIGFVGDIHFRYDQNWIRKCELKLVAIAVNKPHGVTITGATTEPFEVKDKRNTYNSKCRPPRLDDPVQRLQQIGKAFSGCLIKKNVETVKDFLTQLSLNPQRLRDILGMSAEKWDATVKHAKTCELGSGMSLYTHISFDQKKIGVVFNVVAEVIGLYSESVFKPSIDLSEKEKADARKLLVAAFEHREEVKNFDDGTSMNAYWESLNATSASGSPTTASPLVPYIEASTSYDVPATSSYNSEGSFSHYTSPLVHGPLPFTDVTDSLTLENCVHGSSHFTHVTDSLTLENCVHGSSHFTDVTDSLTLENRVHGSSHFTDITDSLTLENRVHGSSHFTDVTDSLTLENRVHGSSHFTDFTDSLTLDNLNDSVHGSSHFKDFIESQILENLNDSASQSMFSDAYVQSNFSFTPYIGSESENDNISSNDQDWSFPIFSPTQEDFWENELLGFEDVDDYQNSEEDMQRLLACAAVAQRRWRLLFKVLKWSFGKRTASADAVSSEMIQAPKRSRNF